jgi:hypothetical protein
MELIKKFLVIFCFIFCLNPSIFAEEQITIATYYPSPYGVYNQLQADKLGIGDVDGDGSLTSSDLPTTSGVAWIAGSLGISTRETPHRLTLSYLTPIIKNSAGDPAYYLYKGDSGLTNKYLGFGFTGSRFSFFNDNDGSYPWTNEYMIIDGATGNVGIGTINPQARLSVVNNTVQGHLGYNQYTLLGHVGWTRIGVWGINTGTGANDWAGYFSGKLYVDGNLISTGNLSASSVFIDDNDSSTTSDVVASSLSTSSLELSGETITSWPAMSCRVVIVDASGSNTANAACANDEYLTGGGCYWQEISTTGEDKVYQGRQVVTGDKNYGCAADANGNKTARAICCKVTY